MIAPDEVILWNDNNIVITLQNCDITLVSEETDSILRYRYVELETGQRFAELDGWHYRIRYNKTWVHGWEHFYEIMD